MMMKIWWHYIILPHHNTQYCDMSTHCWVVQLVSRHRLVNEISAQTRWRHATVLEYGSYAAM
jgi:hypothetical protein